MRMATCALALTVIPTLHARVNIDTNDSRRIRITVPIDLVGGEDDVAARWNQAIKKFWNDGPFLGYFKYCGKKVEFVPDVHPIAAGQQGRPDADKITMRLVREGVYVRSNVLHHGEFDPANNSGGNWTSTASDQIIAHEFGHLLGLRDEYFYLDNNHNGKRDPHEPTAPKPEFRDGSLMAGPGKILQRHIDEAMNKLGITGCKEAWEGTMRVNSNASYACTDGWEFLFKFEISADGTVEGRGSSRITSGPSCPFAIPKPSWQTNQYNVFGKRSGDVLSLRFALTTWAPKDGVEWAGTMAVYDVPANPTGGPPVKLTITGSSARGEGSWRHSTGTGSLTATGIVTARCIENCSSGSS
jgi:hypothetical protein